MFPKVPACRLAQVGVVVAVAEASAVARGPVTPGGHLGRRRLELGLLQKEVAVQLGVSESTVQHWERGETSPALRFVPRAIEFLGYDPHPAPTPLPDCLLAARRGLGLSRRLGLDEETLARWERGTRQPRRKYHALVDRFVGVVSCPDR